MKKDFKNNRVVVAMSGGVDSSVAAALLKEGDLDVVGIFIKFWKDGNDGKNRCCSIDSEKRARLVCEKLSIPFYVFNLEREFKKEVVDYFLKSYKLGLTPNPCVVCNKEIKFGLLIKKALSIDAQYIATGHYCLLGEMKDGYKLLKGNDKEKDQSYFLWQLNQKQLSRVLFPVGGYTKSEVRQLAKEFKLPTATTPESQEVCFIENKTDDFLEKYIGQKPGDIVENGKQIGTHKGLWFYTIGQRKGIKLPNGPYYVISKNDKKNQLIVSKNEKDLLTKEFEIKNINWIYSKPKGSIKVNVKIRYKSKAIPAVVKNNKVIFIKPQRAVTPGQSAVFYVGKELIGGGIIKK